MATETAGLDNSYLGDYYMRLAIGPYERPKPFSPSKVNYDTIVYLPLPLELRDDTAVNYSNLDLNSVGDVINGSLGSGAVSAGMRMAGGVISNTLSGAAGALAGFAGGAAMGSKFGNIIQGNVEGGVKDLFPPDQITSAIQQASGMAPNPNPSVMFTGPSLREFSFSWTLMAKNQADSKKIRNLVALLKRKALPENTVSGSAALLNYPHMVQCNFFPWDDHSNNTVVTEWGWGENSIIRMKKCVMASVNANYNPSNVPAFFHGTRDPVAVQISINFKEIEYMLSNDWGGGTGGDLQAAITKGETSLNAVETPLTPTASEEQDAVI